MWYFDMTKENVFTLSDETKEILRDVTADVNIYFTKEEDAIIGWNQAMSGFVNDTNVGSKVAKVLNQARISRYSFGECGACGAPVIKPDKCCSECGAKLEWSDDE